MPDAIELPELPFAPWEAAKTTLHLYSQVVGKVRLAHMPFQNHWWNVTLYPSARGISTHRMPYPEGDFEIEFDFLDHALRIRTSDGREERFALRDGLSVADFYRQTMDALGALGISTPIKPVPYGVPITTPFADDLEHHAYDVDAVRRYWTVLRWSADVMAQFASGFVGKQSPPHLFWHGFDLALGRFSGKAAPPKPPGTKRVEREAYSHEVIAIGFWPGDANSPNPAYYTYTAPEPPTLTQQPLPAPAGWFPSGSGHLGALPYEAVRTAADPRAKLLEFFRAGYAAGTGSAGWDASALEHRP